MKYFCLILACIAAASAYVIQDDQGEEFLVVPLHRQRRQTTWGVSEGTNGQRSQTTWDVSKGTNGGVRATVGHQGTIYDNGVHRLDGAGSVSKQFHPSGPLSTGGQLGYTHVPSGSTVNVGAQNTRGFGTDFGANANANLWRRGNSRLDAVGTYSRHYGGPWGTGRPDYYGGLQFTHRF